VFFSAPVCSVTDGLFDIAVSLLKGEDCIKTVFQYPDDTILIEGCLKTDRYIELKIDDTVFTCTLERFVRQLLNTFDSYKYNYNEKEYGLRNEHHLPKKQIERLRHQFKLMKFQTIPYAPR